MAHLPQFYYLIYHVWLSTKKIISMLKEKKKHSLRAKQALEPDSDMAEILELFVLEI